MNRITWCKFILLMTDLLVLFSSLFIAYDVLDIARDGRFYFPLEEFDCYGFGYGYVITHIGNHFGLS